MLSNSAPAPLALPTAVSPMLVASVTAKTDHHAAATTTAADEDDLEIDIEGDDGEQPQPPPPPPASSSSSGSAGATRSVLSASGAPTASHSSSSHSVTFAPMASYYYSPRSPRERRMSVRPARATRGLAHRALATDRSLTSLYRTSGQTRRSTIWTRRHVPRYARFSSRISSSISSMSQPMERRRSLRRSRSPSHAASISGGVRVRRRRRH